MAESARDWLWLPESKPEPMLKFESSPRISRPGNTYYIKDICRDVEGRDDLAGDSELQLLKSFPNLQCFEPMKKVGSCFYFLKDVPVRVWWDGQEFLRNCPYGGDQWRSDSYIVTRNRDIFKKQQK